MTTGLKIGIGALTSTGVIGGTAGVSYLLSQPKNLKEDLEKEGVKFLDTESDTDKTSWTTLAKEHAKSPTTNNIAKISTITINASDTDPHPGIAQLKAECKKFFKKTKEETDYEASKKHAKNWCSKDSPLLTPTKPGT
ncbi:hypothetical protein A6V39_03750 [Candidatus Mycoplasma haematobovis]|uniref:Uncharacterized protein n=1 Tax=Candidatus Mycoplasma haematobovis TaxID=432608 RepID=A0A1A9QDB9_9MOLU|nr:hypothetical protein [Candidatus Mycoplasma haematobovis]OAL10001.1 hypothetical protein A6V39_03750 [Candidatus Mycoplasma haematobovis]